MVRCGYALATRGVHYTTNQSCRCVLRVRIQSAAPESHHALIRPGQALKTAVGQALKRLGSSGLKILCAFFQIFAFYFL